MLNPELPLQLSVQLHKKLQEHNQNIHDKEKIDVRIGLSSGPVFILNDLNDNKNLWGPGLVLARRVMDLGDASHILITGPMAEELISLNDDYRNIIKPVSEYKIKHGQIVKIYSVYSAEFGNSNIPEKIQSYLKKE